MGVMLYTVMVGIPGGICFGFEVEAPSLHDALTAAQESITPEEDREGYMVVQALGPPNEQGSRQIIWDFMDGVI